MEPLARHLSETARPSEEFNKIFLEFVELISLGGGDYHLNKDALSMVVACLADGAKISQFRGYPEFVKLLCSLDTGIEKGLAVYDLELAKEELIKRIKNQ